MRSASAICIPFIVLSLAISSPGATQPPTHICVQWTSTICFGGDNALTSTAARLTYKYSEESLDDGLGSIKIHKNESHNVSYALLYSSENITTEEARKIRYLFKQREHGGGHCNCLQIYFDPNCDMNTPR